MTAESAPPRERPEGERLIRFGIAAFLVSCVLVVLAAIVLVPLRRPPPPAFAPTQRAEARPDGSFTMTVDARARDAAVGVDLRQGALVPPEQADLVLQRTVVRAPHGAANLGTVDLASAAAPADVDWQQDAPQGGVVESPAFHRWYAYSYGTHLLRTRGEAIAVRLGDARVALVRIDSYYCAPEGSGCVTLTWRLP